jgi:hypothetical protein
METHDAGRLTNLLLQMQERSREGLMISPLIDEALAIMERHSDHGHVVRDPTPTPVDPDLNAVHRAIERSARHMPTMWGDILT